MNLDLLKKLTKLANNNPNEYEANLAARKVCKMLEENNWSLSNGKSSPSNQTSGSSISMQDIMEMIRRQREEEQKKYYYKPSKAQEDFHKAWAYGFGPSKPSKEKRPLECTKCHKMKETGYIGNLYVCHDCQWNEHNKRGDI